MPVPNYLVHSTKLNALSVSYFSSTYAAKTAIVLLCVLRGFCRLVMNVGFEAFKFEVVSFPLLLLNSCSAKVLLSLLSNHSPGVTCNLLAVAELPSRNLPDNSSCSESQAAAVMALAPPNSLFGDSSLTPNTNHVETSRATILVPPDCFMDI